jgi:hypothetical protein
MTRAGFAVLAAIALASLAKPSAGATPTAMRANAIAWLTTHQNSDGSWGAGRGRWTVTSEALLAFQKAGRGDSVASRRAQGWLLHNDTKSIDARARALRALKASGVYVTPEALSLNTLANTALGWGVTPSAPIDSYDSALALGALKASGVAISLEQSKLTELLARRRGDQGWSGDAIPYSASVPDTASDRVTTAEIVRAMAGFPPPFDISTSITFISGTTAPPSGTTPTLEIAARLAARHSWGFTDGTLETALLNDARLVSGVWSASDPLVNAMGLLALATKPGTFTPLCPNGATNDSDCDGTPDASDAFRDDPTETADLDGDGIGNNSDLDRDGDGVPNAADAYPLDPGEWANLDGDLIADNTDPDDDGDGIADANEYPIGTDPRRVDSDGDGFSDGPEVVALAVSPLSYDLDEDGFIDGEQPYTTDPADDEEHPGMGGDVAPLGHPDAKFEMIDRVVFLRILSDPSVLDDIPGSQQHEDVAEGALDANRDGKVDAGDAAKIFKLSSQP